MGDVSYSPMKQYRVLKAVKEQRGRDGDQAVPLSLDELESGEISLTASC